MNKKKPFYKQRWFWIIVIVVIIIISAFIPQIINLIYPMKGFCFTVTSFKDYELLSFYGSFLTFIGTVCLGALALWQNFRLYDEMNKPNIIINFKFIESRLAFIVENTGNSSAKELKIKFNQEAKKCIYKEIFFEHISKLEQTPISLPPKQQYIIYVDIIDTEYKSSDKKFVNATDVRINCNFIDERNKEHNLDFCFDMSLYKSAILDYKPEIVRLKDMLEEKLKETNTILLKLKEKK